MSRFVVIFRAHLPSNIYIYIHIISSLWRAGNSSAILRGFSQQENPTFSSMFPWFYPILLPLFCDWWHHFPQAAPRRCVAAAMSPEPYMCDPVFEAPGGLESGWRLQKIQQTWEGLILLVHYPSCHSFSKSDSGSINTSQFFGGSKIWRSLKW